MSEIYKNSLNKIRVFRGLVDGELVFLPIDDCVLVSRMQKHDLKFDVDFFLDEDECYEIGAFFSLLKIQEYILLIPGNSNKFVLYNSLTKECKHIPYETPTSNRVISFRKNDPFFCGFSYGRYAYVIGITYPGILKINVDTGCITYICNWISAIEEKLEGKLDDAMKYYFSNGVVCLQEKSYIPVSAISAIMKIDHCSEATFLFELTDYSYIHGICCFESKIFFLGQKNDGGIYISEWEEYKGIKKEIFICNQGEKKVYWWEPIVIGNELIIVSSSHRLAYKVEINRRIVTRCKSLISAMREFPNNQYMYNIGMIGECQGKLIINTLFDKNWYLYDARTNKTTTFICEISNEDFLRRNTCRYYRKKYCDSDKKFFQEKEFPLVQYLKNI